MFIVSILEILQASTLTIITTSKEKATKTTAARNDKEYITNIIQRDIKNQQGRNIRQINVKLAEIRN